MNVCEDSHEPKYQITYKSSTPKYQAVSDFVTSEKYTPVWLVCEKCMENKECFGAHDEIESVEVLA